MIVVLQRVTYGNVTINGTIYGEVDRGLVILLGVMSDDEENDVDYLVNKVSGLRIFDDVNGKWSDDEEAIVSRDKIAEFIDYACSKYPVDKYNVTLLGFSQGTILNYAVALTYPEKVNNIIALSGYINVDILPKNIEAKDYSHLKFYCSHGSVDEVIPVDWARQAPKFLSALNINHQYSEFPVGHGVSPQNFYEFKKWLLKNI